MGKEEMHVVSLSGGKDSTAMLLMMLEKNMRVDEIVFCDTSVEYPEMYRHLQKVESYTGREITYIKDDKPFLYYLLEHEVKSGKRKGFNGYGWASMPNKWCTGQMKVKPFNKYMSKYADKNIQRYIGIAFDERHRKKEHNYPLIDWKVTEKDALDYCYSLGFDWEGLYEEYHKVSCWLCPCQSLDSLRALRKYHPDLWEKLYLIDQKTDTDFQKGRYSLEQIRRKFDLEDRGLIRKNERKAVFMTDEELIERKDQIRCQLLP